MAETFTNPIPNDGIYKYAGHTTFNGGTINGTPHVIRPKVMNTAAEGIETVEDLEGKYVINVHDLAVQRNREEFVVKFIADLNTKSTDKTVHTYGEDWDGQFAYPDMLLNQLRERQAITYAIENASNVGGRWMWKEVHSTAITAFSAAHASGTVNLATGVNTITAATRKAEYTLATYNGVTAGVLPLAFELNTGEACLGGSAADVIFKMIGILRGNDYLMAGGDGTAVRIKDSESKEWYGMLHNTTSAKTVHLMFPDLAIVVDGIEYQEHEVVVQLEAFWYTPTLDQFVFFLNFGKSNLRTALGATNTVNLEEMVKTAGTFSVGAYTRLDHQALVGYFDTLDDGIEEGSGARLDAHTIWQNGIELKQNFVQTFRSKPLEITGTRLATGSYRVDDIQKNRDKMFSQYNTIKNNAMLWGRQSQKLGKHGRPVRTMSGIFDYSLNQIRYMRTTLNLSSSANYSETIEEWLNNIAYSYAAFMEKKGNRVITFACSHDILRSLSKVVKLSYGQQPNLYGTQPAMAPSNPNSVDFGIKSYDFISSYGITLRFIHAPEFDMMTQFKLPNQMVGTGVKPRNIILALDKEYLSTAVLRPDKIQGNIQGNDEDLTREDIIGECTLELLYPKNHAVIICDVI